jgi:hypothetical protein
LLIKLEQCFRFDPINEVHCLGHDVGLDNPLDDFQIDVALAMVKSQSPVVQID